MIRRTPGRSDDASCRPYRSHRVPRRSRPVDHEVLGRPSRLLSVPLAVERRGGGRVLGEMAFTCTRRGRTRPSSTTRRRTASSRSCIAAPPRCQVGSTRGSPIGAVRFMPSRDGSVTGEFRYRGCEPSASFERAGSPCMPSSEPVAGRSTISWSGSAEPFARMGRDGHRCEARPHGLGYCSATPTSPTSSSTPTRRKSAGPSSRSTAQTQSASSAWPTWPGTSGASIHRGLPLGSTARSSCCSSSMQHGPD